MTSHGITITIAGRTDVGRMRDHNEDAFLVADLSADGAAPGAAAAPLGPRGALLMVADGMGGAAAGEVASAMAIETILDEMRARWITSDADDADHFAHALREATEAANRRIHSHAKSQQGMKGMGTTATLVGVLGPWAFLSQVGDSRAYLVRGGVATQLTKDQSLMQRLIDAGEITEEEAAVSERRNIILQALGPEPRVRVDLTAQHLCRGDVLVLCSDGLSGQVRASAIAEAITGATDLDAACAVLIAQANAAGGPDNITVVAARVEGEALPAQADAPPGYRPYVGEQAARATQRVDRTSLAAIAATPELRDAASASRPATPITTTPTPTPADEAAARPRRRTSEMLEAEDEALITPKTALALLGIGVLLIALWLFG
ncbi:MAG: PP2C family protein-serine/threonine phosphatase [Gemmatimonadota bacterium]